MAIKLNRTAYDHAKQLIAGGRFVHDDRDAWSEHRPAAQDENRYIEEHGYRAYAKWHLAVDDERPEDTKGRYKFPYGDFERVHRCAVLSAESRAGQYGYEAIRSATAHLHGMLEAAPAGGG